MKLNETMIKRLAAGEIAVKNDGTLEQLTEVLRAAFPEYDRIVLGDGHYYLLDHDGLWIGCYVTDKTIHPISDFYTEDQPEFVRGEVVEVRDNDKEEWRDGIYLCTIEGALDPYICVSHSHKKKYLLNQRFLITGWSQIRKLQPKQIEVTREEIAAWKGCKPEDIVII